MYPRKWILNSSKDFEQAEFVQRVSRKAARLSFSFPCPSQSTGLSSRSCPQQPPLGDGELCWYERQAQESQKSSNFETRHGYLQHEADRRNQYPGALKKATATPPFELAGMPTRQPGPLSRRGHGKASPQNTKRLYSKMSVLLPPLPLKSIPSWLLWTHTLPPPPIPYQHERVEVPEGKTPQEQEGPGKNHDRPALRPHLRRNSCRSLIYSKRLEIHQMSNSGLVRVDAAHPYDRLQYGY